MKCQYLHKLVQGKSKTAFLRIFKRIMENKMTFCIFVKFEPTFVWLLKFDWIKNDLKHEYSTLLQKQKQLTIIRTSGSPQTIFTRNALLFLLALICSAHKQFGQRQFSQFEIQTIQPKVNRQFSLRQFSQFYKTLDSEEKNRNWRHFSVQGCGDNRL